MKLVLRIIIYSIFTLLTLSMLYFINSDIELSSAKITPSTFKILNTVNGKFLFLKTWRLIKTAYYEPEMNHQDWQRWKDRYLDKINTVDDAVVAINSMLVSLDDPYSVFMDEKEFQDQMNKIDSKINGIGVHITFESGKVLVFSVIENTPAQKAGLKAGDIIIRVDDKDTQGLSTQAVANLIRGEKGSTVHMVVMRSGKKIEKDIIRDEIKLENVTRKMIDGYAYIKIHTFIAETVPEEFLDALDYADEHKAKGYILDLRGNTGGLLSNAIYIANLFMKQGDVVLIVDRNGVKNNIAAKYNPEAIEKPVVVLIDSLSASASEILSGALKDNKRAVLVGDTTFGKGLVQKIYTMPNSTGMNLTISKYLTPNGTDIHKIGIQPDYKVKMSYYDYIKKNDTQLKKAVQVIKKL